MMDAVATPASSCAGVLTCCKSSTPGNSSQQPSSRTQGHQRNTPSPDSTTGAPSNVRQPAQSALCPLQPAAVAAAEAPAAGQAAATGQQVQSAPAPAQQQAPSVLDQLLAKQHLAPVSGQCHATLLLAAPFAGHGMVGTASVCSVAHSCVAARPPHQMTVYVFSGWCTACCNSPCTK